jgi:hypothetical protein
MKYRKSSIAIASAAILAVGTQFAGAVPTMTISDGTTTITITDGLLGDANAATGAVTFVGAVGAWTINVDTGTTMPALGTPTFPHMSLNFSTVSNLTVADILAGNGTLTVMFSEIGFGPLQPGAHYETNVGGTTEGTVTSTTLLDGGNALWGLGGTVIESGTHSTASYNQDTNAPGNAGSPFSLTKTITITHAAGNLTSGGKTVTAAVPDGGTTLALLGGSLLGLGTLRRKFGKG